MKDAMRELKDKGVAELAAEGRQQREALGRARFRLAAGRLKDTHTLGVMRRQLARTLTALTQIAGAQGGETQT